MLAPYQPGGAVRQAALPHGRAALVVVEAPGGFVVDGAHVPGDVGLGDHGPVARADQRVVLADRAEPEREPQDGVGGGVVEVEGARVRHQQGPERFRRRPLRRGASVHPTSATMSRYSGRRST